MPTKIDVSSSGILIVCTDCPFWFAFAFDMADAQNRSCDHEERVHPGMNVASTRRSKWAARHAADSAKVSNGQQPRSHGIPRRADRPLGQAAP